MDVLSTQAMTCLFCVVTLLKLLAPAPAAAEFRYEATASYSDFSTSIIEDDRYNGSISWFLVPVDDRKGPLAEAAFLSRSSSLRYSYKRAESSAQFPNPSFIRPLPGLPDPMEVVLAVIVNRETSTNTHMLDTRYVVADSSWIVGSSLSVGDGDVVTNGAPSDLDNWSGALTLGCYVLTNTTVSLRAEYSESEMTTDTTLELMSLFSDVNQINEITSELEVETVDIAAIAEHVGTFGGYRYRLAGSAGYLSFEGDDTTESIITDAATGELIPDPSVTSSRTSLGVVDGWRVGLSGAWYFTDRIGLNASYQFTDLTNQQSSSLGIGASWFITRYLEIRGDYQQLDVDGTFNNSEQWGVAIRGRF